MTVVTDNPGILYLGKVGEGRTRTLAFREPRVWAERFGHGVAQLLVSPPGHGKAYPVILDERDGLALWHVTAADTARPGYGRCELRWSVDGAVRKSRIYTTYVAEGLSGSCGCGGDSWGEYLEQVTRAGADAMAAASRAENAVFHAPTIINGNWWVWEPDEGGYADTGVPATGEPGGPVEPDSLGKGLAIVDGKLTVDTTDNFEGDNTLPMTAAGVQTTLGNIETLLQTI